MLIDKHYKYERNRSSITRRDINGQILARSPEQETGLHRALNEEELSSLDIIIGDATIDRWDQLRFTAIGCQVLRS